MAGKFYNEDIENALKVLKAGEVILYPTDTVWGLGCDATQAQAVDKVINIKGRDAEKAFIVLIDDLNKLNRYIKNVPEIAYELMELSPSAMTIIFDEGINVANAVKGSDGSLAVRCVKDEFCRDLIYKLNKPLLSTSANLSGEKTPGNFAEIAGELKQRVNYVVGWRQHEKTKSAPSTLIRLKNNGEFSIIRK